MGHKIFVIIRVSADRFGKRLKLTHRCFDDHQFKDSRQIHRGKLFMQNIRNSLVLLKISGKRTN